MVRGYIKTIYDFMNEYYGGGWRNMWMQRTGIQKDAPFLTSTTAAWNVVYGRTVWEWINTEAHAFALLPKEEWTRSGFRVITAAGKTSAGGQAENAALPATTKPTLGQDYATPKEIATTFDVSQKNQLLGGKDDTLEDPMAFMREYHAREHKKLLNIMLMKDCSAEAAAASANRTTTDLYNFESLDRIISCDAEEDDFGGTYTSWFDIYQSGDRDSSTTYDAQYDGASSTDRTLTLDMIDDMFDLLYPYGWDSLESKFILTGNDTLSRIGQLMVGAQRFFDKQTYQVTMNGVQTRRGAELGFQAATYNDVPLFKTKDCAQDTISRIYFIDGTSLKLRVLAPTIYFEGGMMQGNPFGVNRLGNEGLYYTCAETVCTRFVSQGKIRDLK